MDNIQEVNIIMDFLNYVKENPDNFIWDHKSIISSIGLIRKADNKIICISIYKCDDTNYIRFEGTEGKLDIKIEESKNDLKMHYLIAEIHDVYKNKMMNYLNEIIHASN